MCCSIFCYLPALLLEGSTLLNLDVLYLTFFFFFLPGTCRIFPFTQDCTFHDNFPMCLFSSVVLSNPCVLSADVCFSQLAPVFLSRAPIIWVLYFQTSSLISSYFLSCVLSLYLFALSSGNFFNFNF